MTAFDALSADKLRADVDPAIVGREIVVVDEATSTNDSVLERTLPSTLEGLVVFAERQTAGRGQRSNFWESADRKMRAQKNAPHIAIVGIGGNVHHQPEDFSEALRTQAISLAMALDREIDRHQFAVALLRNLDRTYGDAFAR